MGVKQETGLQQRLQVLLRRRGAYVNKNHGNMITAPGHSDLSITYQSLSLHWEVKTPENPTDVSEEQGIHCRLAKKAGAITAIISNSEQAELILNHLDYYVSHGYSIPDILKEMDSMYKRAGLDDGTTY